MTQTDSAPPKKPSFLVVLMIALGVMVVFQILQGPDYGELNAWRGKPAPDFQITTVDGKTMRLSDFKGRRVIVDIWATWCPPCLREIQHFNRLAAELGRDKLVIIAISGEEEIVVREFARRVAMNYNVASSIALPAPFSRAPGVPTTFFIDRNGIIDAVAPGYHEYSELKAFATAADFVPAAK